MLNVAERSGLQATAFSLSAKVEAESRRKVGIVGYCNGPVRRERG